MDVDYRGVDPENICLLCDCIVDRVNGASSGMQLIGEEHALDQIMGILNNRRLDGLPFKEGDNRFYVSYGDNDLCPAWIMNSDIAFETQQGAKLWCQEEMYPYFKLIVDCIPTI